jgi:hypothetical protein
MDNFFEQIQSMFGDQELVQNLIEFIAPHEGDEGKIITAYSEDDGEIVFSIFSKEEYQMVHEMAKILKKPVEDIIRDLSPDEVEQFYYDPGQDSDEDFDCIDPECDCHDLDED